MGTNLEYGEPSFYLAMNVLDEISKGPYLNMINLYVRLHEDENLGTYFEDEMDGFERLKKDLEKTFERYTIEGNPDYIYVGITCNFKNGKLLPPEAIVHKPKYEPLPEAPIHTSGFKN